MLSSSQWTILDAFVMSSMREWTNKRCLEYLENPVRLLVIKYTYYSPSYDLIDPHRPVDTKLTGLGHLPGVG